MVPRHPGGRRGVAVLECALTLPIVLVALAGLLDLGLAATQYNGLAEVSRHIAREAIRHGSLAPAMEGTWGPEEFQGTMATESEMVAGARTKLIVTEAENVEVRITWLDNSNAPGNRVMVEVSTLRQPLIRGLLVWGPLELRSSTTMTIVN
jgi:Flp pilus assembly protein TadG